MSDIWQMIIFRSMSDEGWWIRAYWDDNRDHYPVPLPKTWRPVRGFTLKSDQ